LAGFVRARAPDDMALACAPIAEAAGGFALAIAPSAIGECWRVMVMARGALRCAGRLQLDDARSPFRVECYRESLRVDRVRANAR
jgi:hypothetical protein